MLAILIALLLPIYSYYCPYMPDSVFSQLSDFDGQCPQKQVYKHVSFLTRSPLCNLSINTNLFAHIHYSIISLLTHISLHISISLQLCIT